MALAAEVLICSYDPQLMMPLSENRDPSRGFSVLKTLK